jgi:hypothetical protein
MRHVFWRYYKIRNFQSNIFPPDIYPEEINEKGVQADLFMEQIIRGRQPK